jgi:hypothetical protein
LNTCPIQGEKCVFDDDEKEYNDHQIIETNALNSNLHSFKVICH